MYHVLITLPDGIGGGVLSFNDKAHAEQFIMDMGQDMPNAEVKLLPPGQIYGRGE